MKIQVAWGYGHTLRKGFLEPLYLQSMVGQGGEYGDYGSNKDNIW